MDRETLIKKLMATFLEELDEHVRAFNRDLLALEKSPAGEARAELLHTLFRTAHSLKGASRSVNVFVIEHACHCLEEILSGFQAGRTEPDQVALLFETADAIAEAGTRLRSDQPMDGSPLSAILPRLQAAGPGPKAATSRVVPAVTVPANDASTPAQTIAPAESPPAESPAASASVRVAADKLDSLLAQSGELLVARYRLEARLQPFQTLYDLFMRSKEDWRRLEKTLGQLLRPGPGSAGNSRPAPERLRLLSRRNARALERLRGYFTQIDREWERLASNLSADVRSLQQAAATLDDEVRYVRMLPFAEACQGLERMVRDLALAAGKEVELVVREEGVELDRTVLECLKDPLRHLVRNAVDHGAETREERQSRGKAPRTRVTVSAVLRGTRVEVSVADDGHGLNLDALRRQARRRGLAEPADERELAHLIFLPGFTTATVITDVSGRGVGLDVVKSRVESLHGSVDVAFTPGQGTRFTLAVPLTLTTLRALLIRAGGQTYAVAGTHVEKLVRVEPAGFRAIEGRPMLALGGVPLPLASLADTLGLPPSPSPAGGKAAVLVVTAGTRRLALIVDEFLAEQEIVIKGLGARIRRVPHVAGATILPSGRVALVLNVAHLVRTVLHQAPSFPLVPAASATPPPRKRLLLVEDSVTTRTLEKTILEAAGYDVAVASDGQAAWQLLQEYAADLVVSDVEMPRMDGFELTEAIRAAPRFHELPVVLVTAHETEQDRARGIAVGADAYLLKSTFDQKNLLETVAQLL